MQLPRVTDDPSDDKKVKHHDVWMHDRLQEFKTMNSELNKRTKSPRDHCL